MPAPDAATIPADAPRHAPAARASYPPRQCPECAAFFPPASYQQAFCCEAHKRAYNNRLAVEGRAIATIAKAWRLCRNRSGDKALGSACLGELTTILDKFNAEDRKAGRAPAMVHARSLLAQGRYIDRERAKK